MPRSSSVQPLGCNGSLSAPIAQHLASLIGSPHGEWLVITPEGFFDASANGAHVLSIVRGLEVFGMDQFYQALYRPDLVREKLAGDPDGKVRAAAAKLDLARLIDSGPRSIALHDYPASIEATSGEIELARAQIEPSCVAPLHTNPDVAVDLQDELPFGSAL